MHDISLNALMQHTYLSYSITYFICIMLINFRNQTFTIILTFYTNQI